MRVLCILALSLIFSTPSFAVDTTCDGIARSRSLAGPPRKSFMTKCMRDAKAKCDLDAEAKKLTGTAHMEFLKTCLREAVGG